MLTINTNLSSLIAQTSLKQSTNALNQAIERMSTGFKINHSKDNAANYSIVKNMDSKISALQVAEDNVMQGLDMISTANGVLDEINDRVQRLRDLQEQASNGTYGEQSLKAINVEVNALIDEINRMYQTTNYNNVVLFEKNEVIDDGTMAIKREVSANEESTFKDLGISNSTMEIYDIDDNLIATVDVTEEDTIGDLFTALNTEGFQTKIQNGQITIASFNSDYVSGDLADALGISKQIKTYVVSTEQSFDNEITKTLSSTETLTDTITTTTSETITETIFVTTTTSTTNTETVTETIQVETTTVTTTETVTTIYTAQTETLKVTQTTGFIQNVTRRDTSTMTALSSMASDSELASGTYKISTTAELQQLATLSSGGYLSHLNPCEFVLANNIDLSSISNWTPIESDLFWYTFDGNGYVISNLTINNETAYHQGLFGHVEADIKNLGLENVNVKSANSVGGIASYICGYISNCYVSGNVSGEKYVGGVVGETWNATIEDCYTSGTVSGEDCVGGVAGENSSNSGIMNCYVLGNVSGKDSVGGVVGLNYESTIEDCYTSGIVSGVYFVGGVAGWNNSNSGIMSCYALADVSGTDDVGGLIGLVETGGQVSYCYSKGTVTGSVGDYSINNSDDWDGEEFTYDYLLKGPATLSSTLGELGITVNQNFPLPNSTITMTSTMTMQEFINEIKKDSAVTNAELVDGVLLITTANDALDLSTGFLNTHSATQTSTESISTITTTETIMVDKEIETEIYETIWTTTTSSETATETIFTTTTSEQTRTETIYTTNTITLSDSTKLEELGVLSSLRVTVLVDGTRSTFELSKDSTLNDFYSALNAKGITTSTSGNNIVLTGAGDTFIDSNNIKELLELSDVTKTNGNKTTNTESDRFVHFTYVRGVYAPGIVTLQVGTDSDESSRIDCDVYFKLDDLSDVRNLGLNNNNYLEQIDKVLKAINERQTSFGAVHNRLESALEEIATKYENLVSSRSTLRDADIAEVSSTYIMQQILQQASATLLSTANQTPAISLQLI